MKMRSESQILLEFIRILQTLQFLDPQARRAKLIRKRSIRDSTLDLTYKITILRFNACER